MDTYERKKENNMTLGPDFEDQIILYAFLTLSENQALGREIDIPTKFDDLVIRETNAGVIEYSYFQFKHKDTELRSEQSIAWSDLFSNDKKNPFKLTNYFESFLRLDNAFICNIKTLAIVTNVDFLGKKASGNWESDLKLIAANPVWYPPQGPPIQYHVTQKDIEKNLYEKRVCTIFAEKCYGFTPLGISRVKAALMSTTTFRNQYQTTWKETELALDWFLQLLVLCVGQPGITELKKTNQLILKRYFPFYMEDNSHERRYDEIKSSVLKLFKPVRSNEAIWATVDRRRDIFGELMQDFKKEVTLGSSKSYESQVLAVLFKKLSLQKLKASRKRTKSGTQQQDKLESCLLGQEGPFDVLNIYSHYSNSTVVALKVLKVINQFSIQNSLMVQVSDAESVGNVLSYLYSLKEAVSRCAHVTSNTFSFLIQVSPSFTPISLVNKEAQTLAFELSKLQDLRKWIHFIIITEQKLAETDGVKIVEDSSPLQWQNLPDQAMENLVNKVLFVEGGKKSSLAALGFEKNHLGHWIDSRSLAELIIHDESRPLCLFLPQYDDILSSIYVERTLKLPFVSPESMNEQFPENSSHDIQESKLLDDDLRFGTGSEEDRLVIVVDLPGKGKSKLLTSLTNRFLNAENGDKKLTKLLFRINLRDYKKSTWGECSKRTSTSQTVGIAGSDYTTSSKFTENVELHLTGLIEHFIGVDANHSAAYRLSSCIIRNMCLNGAKASVYFLLDGFDEIDITQRAIMTQMIDSLLEAKGIRRIILTSRPDHGLQEKLESNFKPLPLHLNNLDANDQVYFLMKQWKAKLNEEKFVLHEAAINTFVNALVKKARKALKDSHQTFLDIPLHCMIISECFFEDLKRHLHNSESMPFKENPPQFDAQDFELLRLYNRFFETKFDILVREKANFLDTNETSAILTGDLKESVIKVMKRLSVFHIMTHTPDAEVLCRLRWAQYRKSYYAADVKRAMKVGMICGLDDEENFSQLESPHVKFIHRTFAEHFFASYLLDIFIEEYSSNLDDEFLREDIIQTNFTIIFEKIFINSEYAGIRRFFGRMISHHIPNAEENWWIVVKDQRNPSIHWPCIGHTKFNAFLIKLAQVEIEKFDIPRLEDESTLNNMTQCNRLILTMKSLFVEASPIASMLVKCIKVQISKSRSTDEVETLAYCLTVIFLVCFHSGSQDGWFGENQNQVLGAILQWFDPDKPDSKYSEYFAKILDHIMELIHRDNPADPDFHKRRDKKVGSEVLRLVCSRIQHHRNSVFFSDDRLQKYAQAIFEKHCSGYSNRLLPRTSEFLTMSFNQQTSEMFLDVLSLSKLMLPDTTLFNWQVERFEYHIREYLHAVNENSFLLRRCIDPFFFTVMAEFFITNLREMDLEKSERFLETCLNFVNEMLTLAFKNRFFGASLVLCWHLILSDRLAAHLLPSASSWQFFESGIGRSVLIAFESIECCNFDDAAIDRKMLWEYAEPDLKRELDRWLNIKLEELWTKKGEKKFIDFLLKEELFPLSADETRRNRNGLMCLLLSDRVSFYITKKLSQTGLKYLAETIKHVQAGEDNDGTLWECMSREGAPKKEHSRDRLQEIKNQIQQFM